jgi:hypothetical protein
VKRLRVTDTDGKPLFYAGPDMAELCAQHEADRRVAENMGCKLAALGSPSEVVRRWLRAAYADPPPFGETVGAEIPDTVWFDGTAGRTWPALETQ